MRFAIAPLVGLGGLMTSLAGCATPSGATCSPGLGSPVVVVDLFFGLAIPARADLTEQEWRNFQDDTITVNLPQGYTVVNATGAWMNPVTHQTIKENSRILVVALPESADSLAAISRIKTAYQIRFNQQRVGMTVNRACGSF